MREEKLDCERGLGGRRQNFEREKESAREVREKLREEMEERERKRKRQLWRKIKRKTGIKTEERRAGEREKMERLRDGGKTREIRFFSEEGKATK